MALDYDVGTLNVENGNDIVTPVGADWYNNVARTDTLEVNQEGVTYKIVEVFPNGTGRLHIPYAGTTANNQPYLVKGNRKASPPGLAGQRTSGVGAKGDTGNGWISGAGAPGAGVGNDGDFYLDTTNAEFYGPKALGSWGAGQPIGVPGGSVTGATNFLERWGAGQAKTITKERTEVITGQSGDTEYVFLGRVATGVHRVQLHWTGSSGYQAVAFDVSVSWQNSATPGDPASRTHVVTMTISQTGGEVHSVAGVYQANNQVDLYVQFNFVGGSPLPQTLQWVIESCSNAHTDVDITPTPPTFDSTYILPRMLVIDANLGVHNVESGGAGSVAKIRNYYSLGYSGHDYIDDDGTLQGYVGLERNDTSPQKMRINAIGGGNIYANGTLVMSWESGLVSFGKDIQLANQEYLTALATGGAAHTLIGLDSNDSAVYGWYSSLSSYFGGSGATAIRGLNGVTFYDESSLDIGRITRGRDYFYSNDTSGVAARWTSRAADGTTLSFELAANQVSDGSIVYGYLVFDPDSGLMGLSRAHNSMPWGVNSAGHTLPTADLSYDLGDYLGNRFRYVACNFVHTAHTARDDFLNNTFPGSIDSFPVRSDNGFSYEQTPESFGEAVSNKAATGLIRRYAVYNPVDGAVLPAGYDVYDIIIWSTNPVVTLPATETPTRLQRQKVNFHIKNPAYYVRIKPNTGQIMYYPNEQLTGTATVSDADDFQVGTGRQGSVTVDRYASNHWMLNGQSGS